MITRNWNVKRLYATAGRVIFEYVNYRHFLRDTLSGKQEKTPGFSMRAFALKVGLSQSTLSQVLAGKKNLSETAALQIADKLNLSSTDTEYLSLLVRLESAKNPAARELILKQLQKLNPERDSHDLSVDLFRSLADWYHLAVRNLLDIDGFILTPIAVSERLNISLLQAEAAIERLLRLELIEKDPQNPDVFHKVYDHLLIKSESANQALRIFHKQMLEKAVEALESQSNKEKIVGSETFAVNEDQLPQAHALTEEYLKNMAALALAQNKKTQVYHLGIQFFRLTKTNKEKI